jgi:hypothetical protein
VINCHRDIPIPLCSGTRRHKRAVAHPYQQPLNRGRLTAIQTVADYMYSVENCNGTKPLHNFIHLQHENQPKKHIMQFCPLKAAGTPETQEFQAKE